MSGWRLEVDGRGTVDPAALSWRYYRTRPDWVRAACIEDARWTLTAPDGVAQHMWPGAWLIARPDGSGYDPVSRGEFRAAYDALGLDVADTRGILTPEMAMRGILGHEALSALARGKAKGDLWQRFALRRRSPARTSLALLVRYVFPRLAQAVWALRRGDRAAAYARLGSAVGYLAVLVAQVELLGRTRRHR
jgi:hypothetical protein